VLFYLGPELIAALLGAYEGTRENSQASCGLSQPSADERDVLVPSAESRRLTTNGFILIVCVKNVGSCFPSPCDFPPGNRWPCWTVRLGQCCIQSTCNEQCVKASGSRSPAKTERARIAISVMVCP